MFGQLKESVLTNLEKEYAQNGETKFKKQFAKYVKVLKENKSLKEFNEIYDLLNNMRFDNELVAKEFVEESINHLKKLNLSETDELKSLVENVVSIDGTINHSIDELVFNEKITILDKVKHKTKLVSHLLRDDSKSTSVTESIGQITEKLNDKISKLNEEQMKALNLFAENDDSKINSYYNELINDTSSLVEASINESDDIIIVKKLLEVRGKLNEMREQKPNLDNIDMIIDLKKTFE